MSDHHQTSNLEKIQSKNYPTKDGSRSGPAGAGAVAVGAQTPISCAPQLVSGFDTIHLSWSLVVPENVLIELKAAKQKIQSGEENGGLWRFGQTNLFSFELSRVGVKLYPYVLRQGDITLFLSSRSVDSKIPNASLSIGSISSNNNPGELLVTIKKWLLNSGILVKKEMVSRVDIFSDFACDISKLHLTNPKRRVSRVNKIGTFTEFDRITGIQAGKGAIVLRCYDKLNEMKVKKATEKQVFFSELWKGTPDHVTRVEFQLRREAILEFFPDSSKYCDISSRVAEIWRYLTDEWFRQLRKNVDRKNRNQTRVQVSPFWFCVQKAFDLFSVAAERITKKKIFNLKALVQQAGGIMATIAAGVGMAFEDIPGMLHLMDETIGRQLENVLLEKGDKDFYRRAALARLTI